MLMEKLGTWGLILIIIVGFTGAGLAETGKSGMNQEEFVNSIGMKFRLIRAGDFQMGSPTSSGRTNERPRHPVTISRSFYMGVHEVTQRQWTAIMHYNPSFFKFLDNPVERVEWKEIKVFVQLLQLREDDMGYRLPTEAEWEYACRADSQTAWSFAGKPEKLGRFAWYFANGDRQTHPVGSKSPNSWGLYDMHGNVWEWCEDNYSPGYYSVSPKTDPAGPLGKAYFRVLRGGSWFSEPEQTRCANRYRHGPGHYANDVGFRLVFENRSLTPP